MKRIELELTRRDATPAQFLAYVRHHVNKHGYREYSSDLDLEYFAAGNDLNFDNRYDNPAAHHGVAHERSISKPFEYQSYVRNADGTTYNEIVEFVFDDDKAGHGYYYLLNTWNEDAREPKTELDKALQAIQIAKNGTIPEEVPTGRYEGRKGQNGHNYVTPESTGAVVNLQPDGNSKTGPVINYNISIELTCDHRCECYRKGKCYACQGAYNFLDNQRQYTENYNYFRKCDSPVIFAAAVLRKLASAEFTKRAKFRWFTCGDIMNRDFFEAMVIIAIARPDIEFWAYTKKYGIVNHWIDEHGALPGNLCIVFSHWMNDDGSFFPMENPHNLPTSEFIPLGMEDEIQVTHVCPCSDPSVVATCDTCDRPCYRLKAGESMGLQEHSTTRTKARDKAIKAAKAAIKEAAKAARKAKK